MNPNWFTLVISAGVMVLLMIIGSHNLLIYAVLTALILLSSFMLYVGEEWFSNRTLRQLRFMLSLAIAIISAGSAWLLLSDLDFWFKVLYAGIVAYVLVDSALASLPSTKVYVLIDDVKEMPRSNQTPQEFVESDED